MNCPLHNEEAFAKSPAPLTCSEVVERLDAIRYTKFRDDFLTQATAILHSWRERQDEHWQVEHSHSIELINAGERRVQELEEALRDIIAEADQSNGGKGARLPIVLYMKEMAEKALKSEWREQIRKGGKHD